jgi:hypothetical protein
LGQWGSPRPLGPWHPSRMAFTIANKRMVADPMAISILYPSGGYELGHGVQNSRPRGNQTAQGALLP